MPAPTTITILAGQLGVSLTPAGPLVQFDCQVVNATLTANPKLNTVAATFCAAESQSPGLTGWQLDLTVLQDWTDPDGVCWFAFENDGALIYWELALDDAAASEAIMNGTAYVTAISFGGDAGAPLQGSATWPVPAKPEKGPFTVTPLEADRATAAA